MFPLWENSIGSSMMSSPVLTLMVVLLHTAVLQSTDKEEWLLKSCCIALRKVQLAYGVTAFCATQCNKTYSSTPAFQWVKWRSKMHRRHWFWAEWPQTCHEMKIDAIFNFLEFLILPLRIWLRCVSFRCSNYSKPFLTLLECTHAGRIADI